jgi:serine/threonine protein phosphatase PrpC
MGRDGSTAVVCLLVGSKLIVANCGDSSALLVKWSGGGGDGGGGGGRGGGVAATNQNNQNKKNQKPPKRAAFEVVKLTEDHGTENAAEALRVQAAGASLRQQRSAFAMRGFPWCCLTHSVLVGKPRLYPGGLLVTRSFGDWFAKLPELGGIRESFLVAPHVQEVEVGGGGDGGDGDGGGAVGLLLMSDGVSDVLCEAECLAAWHDALANHFAYGEKNPAQCVANTLVTKAVMSQKWAKKGAAPDNTTAVFVQLREW